MTENSTGQQDSIYDPNGVGQKNGNFIGLPFTEEDAQVILFPVPWDVTVSYRAGTSGGPMNILNASYQLDVFDMDIPDAWKLGIYFQKATEELEQLNASHRKFAEEHIDHLENGLSINPARLDQIQKACARMNEIVLQQSEAILKQKKIPGLIGGDHSTPLGLYQAYAQHYDSFGILHLDAHMDLRFAYEGFQFSHASIFRNALQISQLSKIVQVGIRDFCEEEFEVVQTSSGRIHMISDQFIRESYFNQVSWQKICYDIIHILPQHIHVSVDIDAFDPALCPNTGTPVPGGLRIEEFNYLLKLLVEQGKTIIGFDLVEVAGAPHEWDGNVGARIVYKLANLAGRSQNKI